MKRFIAAACMLGWVLFPAAGWSQSTLTPVVKKSPVDMPQRVLFVGSSIMYYAGALQTHTHRLAAAATPPLILRDGFKSVHITTGALHHYPLEHYVTPGNLGGKEPFQLVVLGGNFRDVLTDSGRALYRKTVIDFDAIIKKHGGHTALYWLPPHGQPGGSLASASARAFSYSAPRQIFERTVRSSCEGMSERRSRLRSPSVISGAGNAVSRTW